MKVTAIIQARMGSTRLPGKVMKEVLGKPLLEYQIERIKKSRLIHTLIVGTTIRETEQPIVDLCERLAVNCFRGSEENVLERFFKAAKKFEAQVVVRLTSDCPLIDPVIIDQVIEEYLSNRNLYDYFSNTIERTYPRGFDVEVFSMEALEQSYLETNDADDCEHVTPYLYHHPEKFKVGQFKHPIDLSAYRLTVDTEEDLQLITVLIESLYEKNNSFSLDNILDLLQKNPKWTLLNAHVEQKKVFKDFL